MASPAPSQTGVDQLFQHVVVMRHGDRIDNSEPMWTLTAARPWDPPLDDGGKTRAFIRGRKFRNKLGFPINRVLVSPFLRCVQTASEVVAALCAVDDVDVTRMTSDGLNIDPSKLKVSIEYGLCEMLNTAAIRSNVAPKDGNFSFNLADLEAMFPAGTVDHSVERVYPELPRWQETVNGARNRYVNITKALADKYPSENLLLVTHGEAVGSAVSTYMKGMTVLEVEYCAYAHSQRPISFGENDSFTAGDFELLLPIGQTGIKYCPTSVMADDHLTWQETVNGARNRYVNITKALADKYPSENLLLVTHGEAVGSAVSTYMKGMTVLEVEYCAYAHSQRPISFGQNDSFTAGDFELLLPIGQTGIKYCPTSVIADDHLT